MTTSSASPASPNTSAKAARIGLILGPLLLIMTLVIPAPGGMSESAWLAAGMAFWLATWWATEPIPIPATSLLPIVLIPALGLGSVKEATSPYADPVIFLFLGGFVLGLAMQRWNLHLRIALLTLRAMGPQPSHQIAGFMIATAFISMWVSNTATTVMMLPIGLSVIALLQAEHSKELDRFANNLLLGIAYAASVGGIATLIGTPPNALLAGFLANNHGIQLGFGQWMLIGLPVSVGMLLFIWWHLTRKGFQIDAQHHSADMLMEELRKLGPLSKGEKMVGLVFLLAAAAWIFQPIIVKQLSWVNDTTIAMMAAVLLFLIPVDAGKRIFVMSWEDSKNLPWGVLLLFGGGLSMANIIKVSGLAEWIAQSLGAFGAWPLLIVIGLVVLVIIFLTEVTSNTATAAAFLPLLGALAVAQGISPMLLAVPAAIAASCAFMMPVATPPNAIVFATGHVRIQSMISTGFAINIFGVFFVTLVCYALIGLIWGVVG